MNLEEIRRIARENMEKRRAHLDREPGYIYNHGLRVANLSGELMSLITGNPGLFDPLLYIGALFHDIGKGLVPHNEVGAGITRDLLSVHCTPEEIEGVCDTVRFHCIRKHGLDLTDGQMAVQDADMIDHFGTQEVWLNFLYNAYRNRGQRDVIDFWRGDEFKQMVIRMRELLNFDVSIAVFDDRVAFHGEFLQRFELEAEGRLPEKFLRREAG